MSASLVIALQKIYDMRDNEDADLDDALLIAEKALEEHGSKPEGDIFRVSTNYQFEVAGDERPNVVIPNPAPICPLAFRVDTGEWFVATGVYYKPVQTLYGVLFRDADGGIWRLLVKSPTTTTQP